MSTKSWKLLLNPPTRRDATEKRWTNGSVILNAAANLDVEHRV